MTPKNIPRNLVGLSLKMDVLCVFIKKRKIGQALTLMGVVRVALSKFFTSVIFLTNLNFPIFLKIIFCEKSSLRGSWCPPQCIIGGQQIIYDSTFQFRGVARFDSPRSLEKKERGTGPWITPALTLINYVHLLQNKLLYTKEVKGTPRLEIFDLMFFFISSNSPYWPLMNGLKPIF
jgi:hypothetical protein